MRLRWCVHKDTIREGAIIMVGISTKNIFHNISTENSTFKTYIAW